MNVLPVNFGTCRIFGLWYEEPHHLRPLKLFHQCLTSLLILHFTVLQLVTLVLIRDAGIEVITACLFLSLSYVSASYKLLYFITERPNLVIILDKFRLEVCRPQNPEEIAITQRHNTMICRLLVVRMVTTLSCGFAFLLQCFINGEEKQLPINAYEMFDTSGDVSFVIAYVAQFITAISAISIDVCLDATACAFIILISGQLTLLSHRIETTGGKNCRDYVLHHNLIFDMTKKVQTFFLNIILPTFFCGLITVCSSIYQLSQTTDAADFISFFLYIAFLLNQLYYYCWCGNELQFKSASVTDAIFRSDWTELTPLDRRNYWFIMSIGQRNLVISYHGQCALNLYTYIWMLKTSYGAYNLLEQVSSNS